MCLHLHVLMLLCNVCWMNIKGSQRSNLSNKLHDLCQVLLLLQDLLGLGSQGHKFSEMLVVILIQSTGVFAVADEPVYRREMFPLCKFFIQTPEDL